MPERAPGAKRLLVPECLWEFIHQTAMTVCALCSVELTEAAFSEHTLRLF